MSSRILQLHTQKLRRDMRSRDQSKARAAGSTVVHSPPSHSWPLSRIAQLMFGAPYLAILWQVWETANSRRHEKVVSLIVDGLWWQTTPQGLIGIQHSKQSHFVTFSCYRREARLTEKSTCHTVLHSLERVRRTRGIRLYGYVPMPEHVHMLMSEPERGALCGALQALINKCGEARRRRRNAVAAPLLRESKARSGNKAVILSGTSRVVCGLWSRRTPIPPKL